MTFATHALDDVEFMPQSIADASALCQRWFRWDFSYTKFVRPTKPRAKRKKLLDIVPKASEKNQSRLAAMHSSVRDDWATPNYIFAPLNEEFDFDLDPCCKAETAKCEKFFTPIDDGLSQSWANRRVWMNPPYGRGVIDKWMEKARQSAWMEGASVVCLVPVHAGSQWFKQSMQACDELRFLEGRVRFEEAKDDAPFASAVMVFRPYSPNRLNWIND